MKIRRNMAYRAPAAQEYFGMRAADLKAAAASGDAGAAAELERRAANAADPTTKAGQRTQKWAEMKAQKGGGAKKPSAARDAAVQKAAEEGHITDADYAPEMGAFDTRAKMAALRGRRQDDAALGRARQDLDVLHRAGRMSGNPDATLMSLKKGGNYQFQDYASLRALKAARKDLKTLKKAGTRNNPLPYPGAQVLYPQQGIVQGGTGPFYGPSGTLFDRTPDMLWAYANPRRGSRKNPEILWPQSARKVGVVQGGTSRTYGPSGVPFNMMPDLTEQLLLNGRRKRNPRMEGETILWPQPASRVGPIQGGAEMYMEYPSAAPFDRMPNLTRTLKNKKRSR